jgi:hypothetical protein
MQTLPWLADSLQNTDVIPINYQIAKFLIFNHVYSNIQLILITNLMNDHQNTMA